LARQASSPQVTPSPSPNAPRRNEQVTQRRAPRERVLNTADASIGNDFKPKDSTNVVDLASRDSDTAVLRSGNVRSINGGNGNTVGVSSTAKSIKLRVIVDSESSYPRYRASISKPEGDAIWSSGSFIPGATGGEGIALPAVPSKSLKPGDYILSLEGERSDGSSEPVAKYSLRIVKKPSKP